MSEDNCIFCKIIRGEIPARTVFEDEDFKVIMDASPATKGHVLILPKRHYDDLFALPEDVAAKALPLAARLAARLKEKLGCQGINIVQNNGEAAGQTVRHFHIHVIPRYEDGRKADVTWGHSTFDEAELDRILDTIRQNG